MRVVQVGFGSVGRENLSQLAKRGHRLVGIVDRQEILDGIDPAGFEGEPPVLETDVAKCLASSKANVILLSTSYDPAHMLDVVTKAAAARCDVISANGIVDIVEIDPPLSQAIERTAVQAGIRVLGVGIVPGFFSDLLPLFLTGICADVSAIRFLDRTDFDKYGPDVMRRFGFGLAPEEFDAQAKAGTMLLFERLWQSAHFIAHQLGWPIVKTEEAKQAFVSDRERRGDYAQVKAGTVGGFSHKVVIHSTRSRRIDLEVIGYLDASGAEETPAMSIEIVGDPTFRIDLSGDVLLSSGGVTSTSARMVNSIAALAGAAPGFRATSDLPVVTCRDGLSD
jgi:4-hydroxy-tetrahydrodipicolinate reductase